MRRRPSDVETAVFLDEVVHELNFIVVIDGSAMAEVFDVVGDPTAESTKEASDCLRYTGIYPSIEPQSYTTFSGNAGMACDRSRYLLVSTTHK